MVTTLAGMMKIIISITIQNFLAGTEKRASAYPASAQENVCASEQISEYQAELNRLIG